ncbi:MAG: tRNA 4-thiouridine(8) synthase ThiI [Clostridia bacterium]|nr:tRNA 4-thiouridine(8) synthase ThiI [Clostridia bacterium]
MEKLILIRFSEIHLKGQNRPYFENMLLRRIREAVSPFDGAKVTRSDSRYFVRNAGWDDAVIEKICRVFGVHSVCPAIEMEKDDFSAICRTAAEMMSSVSGSFKVRARRADKHYPTPSPEIAAKIGEAVLMANPQLHVDVHDPEHVLEVEIRDRAYLYSMIIPAAGGMPVGSNGKAYVLLSGGIDSPVAAYMTAKRGVHIDAVHFDSPPYTSARSREKVITLARILTDYCGAIRLHIVPFTEIQQQIYEKCPDRELTILMRRSMMRIAEKIAVEGRGLALVTGESVGQVASQTIESLACTNEVCTLPVIRPLICFDKAEIMELARRIGTYETSILPYEDCCTVFVPRHPATHPDAASVRKSEENVDFAALEAEAIAHSEYIDLYPGTGEDPEY